MVFLYTFLLTGCDKQQQTISQPEVPEVTTITIWPQKVILTTKLPGRAAAFRIAEIRPQVSGLIQKRLFTEGSDITKGHVLYQIDPAPFQAALNAAKATLKRAEANLETIQLRANRFEELLPYDAISKQDYDDAVAALKQAQAEILSCEAQVETALIKMRYTKVSAPISGRIGTSYVTEGAIVIAYQLKPVATIQQIDPIYINVPQSTSDLLYLKQRLKNNSLKNSKTNQNRAKLILEDGTTYPLEGKLKFRDITVDPTTGSVILRIIFPNPKGILLPGMFVRVIIKEGINEQGILVPHQCISRDPKGNPFVLVVNAQNKVIKCSLTIDRSVGNKWLISSGLKPGSRVIVEGRQMLHPGTLIKAVPFKKNEISSVSSKNKTSGGH